MKVMNCDLLLSDVCESSLDIHASWRERNGEEIYCEILVDDWDAFETCCKPCFNFAVKKVRVKNWGSLASHMISNSALNPPVFNRINSIRMS